MKFSTLCLFYLISTTFADRKFFEFPAQSSVYSRGDTIKFISNDVSHDDDAIVQVTLHKASDSRIFKSLGNYTGKEISSSSDDFIFTWSVDVPDGLYYVQVKELEDNSNDDDDNNDDDDSNRSFNFEINTWPYKRPMYTKRQKKRKEQA